MNGSLAQLVALTCHANAFLQGQEAPEFFPANSTCKFCDFVKFFNVSKTLFGKIREDQLAANPNEWFEHLKTKRTKCIRISRTPQNQPDFPDRMSSAFVGGGGTWSAESVQDNGKSGIWLARWKVWNQQAPERRIWQVSYGRVAETRTQPAKPADLESITTRLRTALKEIHKFSEEHNCGGFTDFFARALASLDSGVRTGHHKDLAPAGILPGAAASLLDACQSAWVFGGMGSWNDMGFDGQDQQVYDRVSEQLFVALNEAIESAANASSSTSDR